MVGQFYQDNRHFIPKEIFIPRNIDETLVKAVVNTKIIKPQRGEKKQLVNLATKNARVSLQQKFDLLKKIFEKRMVRLKILEIYLIFLSQCALKPLIIPTFKEPVLLQLWLFLWTASQVRRIIVTLKSKPLSDLMTMPACVEVIYRRYSRVIRDGLTPPDLIIIDGGQGQVNVARDVIENRTGTRYSYRWFAKMISTKPMSCSLVIRVEGFLPRNSEEFFLLQRIQDEVHRFAITFHRQLARSKTPSHQSWTVLQGLALSASNC